MKSKRSPGILGAGVCLLLFVLSGTSQANATADPRFPIRIGWQVPAATQAQIVQVFKRTNVLETQGLDPTLVPFSFGTPEIETALAGKIDVVLAGDQPVVDLISRGGRWKIVARLHYDRVAIMVPPRSPIQQIEDLKGKTVGCPFGSTAQREVILEEQGAGLDPDNDVTNENLDILELRRIVQGGGVERWGRLDAVAVWEPIASQFDLEQRARMLKAIPTLAVVAVSEAFIARHPEAVVRFLVALGRAWYYFSQNADRVRTWYIDDAQLGYPPEALLAAARLDPNFGAASLRDIDLRLTATHIASLERSAAWGQARGQAESRIQALHAVDQRYLAKAMETIATERFEDIQVVLPSAREAPIRDTADIYFFDRFPLWVIFGLMIGVAFLAIEAGQRMGQHHFKKSGGEREGPVGTVVGAVLGLLAFVIALTFSTASSRFDARKQALLDEVNAIGTAYLRAGLIPDPHKTITRGLLRDYVEIRLGMYRAYGHPDQLLLVQRRTAALQRSLWSHVEALAEADRHSPIDALFTASINEVFDLHTKRVVLGVQYRIPLFVWGALGLASCLAMLAVGFHFGIGGRRSLAASLILSLTFALVIMLIFDLDRPGEGVIHVNQRPMTDLYQSLSEQE